MNIDFFLKLSGNNLKDFNYATLSDEDKTDFLSLFYFSSVIAKSKDIKAIPKHLLKNEEFVFSVLEKNPKIYRLSNTTLDKNMISDILIERFPNNYLDFVHVDFLNDYNYCLAAVKKNINNYRYLKTEFKKQDVFIDLVLSKYVYLNEKVIASFPDGVKCSKKVEDFVLFKHQGLIEVLTENQRENFDFMLKIMKKETRHGENGIIFFDYVSDKLKNNKDFIEKLLSWNEKKTLGAILKSNVNKNIIEDDGVFYRNKDLIRNEFYTFSKIFRGDRRVIESIYCYLEEKERAWQMYQCSFFNKITDTEVKDFLTDLLKRKENVVNLKEFGNIVDKAIKTFYLNRDLNSEMKTSDVIIKKMKI